MYAYSHFLTKSEALHLMVSADGLKWEKVCQGKALLEGTVNTRTLRDPFIFRKADNTFGMLATDGWGSTSIIYAESPDLLNWSEQREIDIMASIEGAINAWAPECTFINDTSEYMLYWSSTTSLDSPDQKWNHRIWTSRTKDFVNFTPPQILIDPGYSVIDASLCPIEDGFLLLIKDGREFLPNGKKAKGLRVGTLSKQGVWNKTLSDIFSPPLVEGPSVIKIGELFHLYCDYYGIATTKCLVSKDGFEWHEEPRFTTPWPHPRHGSILEISESEAKHLGLQL